MATNSEIVAEVADLLAQASSALLDFRIDNRSALTKAQRIEIEDAETSLDGLVAIMRGTATRLIAEEAAAPLGKLKAQIKRAQRTIKTIKKVKAVLGVVSALLGVAAAMVAGDVGGLISAVDGLKKANKAADPATDS